jgi:hypothetical protein
LFALGEGTAAGEADATEEGSRGEEAADDGAAGAGVSPAVVLDTVVVLGIGAREGSAEERRGRVGRVGGVGITADVGTTTGGGVALGRSSTPAAPPIINTRSRTKKTSSQLVICSCMRDRKALPGESRGEGGVGGGDTGMAVTLIIVEGRLVPAGESGSRSGTPTTTAVLVPVAGPRVTVPLEEGVGGLGKRTTMGLWIR